MPYQSLYRKYRPQRFAELVGQEHVVAGLRNAVRDQRVSHAYFFSGPRGTGKTTTARIVAKALNCTALGGDGEPCGQCSACLEVAAGSSLDVIEIDAASNNGVDEIRELIERVAYRSASGGKKVYIIDEVHELSARASNALLKTLEDPPDHVVFVLATTNPEKVLQTIRSRTQSFEFSLLRTEQLVAHLTSIAEREGVTASPEALAVVARRGAGSVRDSLSLLDQALAQTPGELTEEHVVALFGGTPVEHTLAVLHAVAGGDVPGVLVELSKLFETGHDPRRVADDLLRALRDALLTTAGAGRVQIAAPEEERLGLQRLGTAMETPAIVRALETIGRAVVDMRGAGGADPRLVLEVALVRLARGEAGSSIERLTERLDRLERRLSASAEVVVPPAAPRVEPAPVATGGVKPTLGSIRRAAEPRPDMSPTVPVSTASDATAPPAPTAPAKVSPSTAPEPSRPVELDDVIVAWAAILPTLPPATRNAVQEAQPVAMEGTVAVFGIPTHLLEAAKPRFKREAETIRTELARRVGTTLQFRIVAKDLTSTSGPVPHDDGGPSDDDGPQDMDLSSYDPSETSDVPPESGPVDSVTRLVEALGASIVEEVPRT